MTLLALAVHGRGLVSPDEPVIRADDEALLRGRAAFETLRVYGGHAFRLEAHLDRLSSSAARIGLPAPPAAAFAELAALVVPEAGTARDAVLRLVWTAGAPGGEPSALALLSEVPTWIDATRERGARAVSLLGVRAAVPWLLPGVKSTSYAVNMAAEAEAKRRGADEAVFVDADGIVLEGTVTNVWWRRGRTLFTPELDLGILAGVTRAALLELAGGEGYEVEQGAYPLAELHARRGGVHVLVGARGDAARRHRRARHRPWAGRRLLAGGAQARGCRRSARLRAPRRPERAEAADLVGTLTACRRRPCGWEGWRSRTACSSTGRRRGGPRYAMTRAALHVASGRKPRFGESIQAPVVSGPLRLAEAFALLPIVRRSLPQARFAFERPAVLGSMVASSLVARRLRASGRSTGGRELFAGAVAFLPAALALRGPDLAEYHGAEHVSIGTYENGGDRAPKEHPRCGSQLVAPMLAASLAANVAVARVPSVCPRAGAAGRDDSRHRGGDRGIRVGVAEPPASPRARSLASRLRAPEAVLDRGAVRRSGRGRGCRARRVPGARAQ